MENRDLRIFGLALAAVIAVLWFLFRPQISLAWLVGSMATVLLTALSVPRALRPVHWLLSRAGHAISKVTTPVLLALLYFVIMTPLGLVMRLFGHDPMRRSPDPAADSYRQPAAPLAPDEFEKPF
jgi:hypothetical protein